MAALEAIFRKAVLRNEINLVWLERILQDQLMIDLAQLVPD